MSLLSLAALSISISACADDGATISGHIESLPNAPGYLIKAMLDRTSTSALATGVVDENANFTIKLPGSSVMQPLLQQNFSGSCGVMPSQSQPQAKSRSIVLVVSKGSAAVQISWETLLTTDAFGSAQYIYFDQDDVISGEVCATGGTSATYQNADFKRGWNVAILDENRSTKNIVIRTGTLPAEIKWYCGAIGGMPSPCPQ